MPRLNESNNSSQLEVTTDVDNFYPIISSETLSSGLFVIDCIMTPVFTVGGVVGNLMSLVVLLQHSMRNGVNICLAAMAMSDTLFILTYFGRKATCIIAQFDFSASEWYSVTTFGWLFFFNLLFGRITTCLTILITLNRFIAVVFPLKIKFYSTRYKMLTASISVSLFCFLLLIPTPFLYEVGEVFIPGQNSTKPYLAPTEWFKENRNFFLAYFQTFLIILFRLVPIVVLLMMNLSIWVVLTRSNKLRRKMTNSSQAEANNYDNQRAITKMLLVISGLFLVCLIPGSVAVIVSYMREAFSSTGLYRNLFSFVSAIAFELELINSAVNFIVYMALSNAFSTTYKVLFCCQKKKKPNVTELSRLT